MSTITHSPELVCLARSLFEVGIDIFFEKKPVRELPIHRLWFNGPSLSQRWWLGEMEDVGTRPASRRSIALSSSLWLCFARFARIRSQSRRVLSVNHIAPRRPLTCAERERERVDTLRCSCPFYYSCFVCDWFRDIFFYRVAPPRPFRLSPNFFPLSTSVRWWFPIEWVYALCVPTSHDPVPPLRIMFVDLQKKSEQLEFDRFLLQFFLRFSLQGFDRIPPMAPRRTYVVLKPEKNNKKLTRPSPVVSSYPRRPSPLPPPPDLRKRKKKIRPPSMDEGPVVDVIDRRRFCFLFPHPCPLLVLSVRCCSMRGKHF